MKRNPFLLISIALLLLTNCKKEDTNNNPDNILTSLISGTWTIDSTIISTYQNDFAGPRLKIIEVPAYFNFFNSNQAYYKNLSVLDTTNYTLICSDIILIDLSNDNQLDTTQITTLVQNHSLLFNWTTKYTQQNIIYKTEELIYLRKY
jgi:hypothetical protein